MVGNVFINLRLKVLILSGFFKKHLGLYSKWIKWKRALFIFRKRTNQLRITIFLSCEKFTSAHIIQVCKNKKVQLKKY